MLQLFSGRYLYETYKAILGGGFELSFRFKKQLAVQSHPGKVSFQGTVSLQVRAEVSLLGWVTLTLDQYSQYCPRSTLTSPNNIFNRILWYFTTKQYLQKKDWSEHCWPFYILLYCEMIFCTVPSIVKVLRRMVVLFQRNICCLNLLQKVQQETRQSSNSALYYQNFTVFSMTALHRIFTVSDSRRSG